MGGERASRGGGGGGGRRGGRKKVSHQKNLISHSDTHENWGRKVGGVGGSGGKWWVGGWGGNGCDLVCVRVCVIVCAHVRAKGIHFQLFHHTSQSTDLFCLFVSLHVCFFCANSMLKKPDRSFFL